MATFADLTGSLLDHELGTSDSNTLFTSQRRQQAVKDGEREFAQLTQCLIRESTVTLTGGTQEYNLNTTAVMGSSDFLELAARGVEYAYTDASSVTTWVTGDDLPRRDIEWLNRYEPGWRASTGSQTPQYYYLVERNGGLYLGFHPQPSTGSSASAKAIVHFQALPDLSTASTYVPFTIGTLSRTDLLSYHQGLVHYAAHQLEKLRRDDQASDRQLQKFVGYITRYLQAMRPKGGRTLTLGKNYFGRAQRRITRATGWDPYRTWP